MTTTASLIVDLHTVRCGGCKVAISDPLTLECPMCGASFDRVVSNHVGLANRLLERRKDLSVPEQAAAETGEGTDLVAVPRELLSAISSALAGIDGAASAAAAVTMLAESAPIAAGLEASAATEASAAGEKASETLG